MKVTNQYWCSACGKPVGLMLDLQGYPRQFHCPNSGRVGEMMGFIGRTKPPAEVASE